MRLRVSPSRLIVALAFVLFGAPQIYTDGTMAHADPVAKSMVEKAKAVLSVQEHLLRRQFLGDDTPDIIASGPHEHSQRFLSAATVPLAPKLSLLSVVFCILPPVRGPPAA